MPIINLLGSAGQRLLAYICTLGVFYNVRK